MNSTSTSTPKVEGTLHAAQRKIAYLLSCYPAVSHTFLLNEIAELRRLGFTIDTLSINPPLWSAGELPAREAAELRQTLYIKTMSKPRILLLLLKTLLRHPPVVARGLWAALKLDPWSLRNTLYAVFYLIEAFIVGDYLRKSGHRHLHVHFGRPWPNLF